MNFYIKWGLQTWGSTVIIAKKNYCEKILVTGQNGYR